MSPRVLMIVTGHDRLGATGKATGLYLSEFAHPYAVFQHAGYRIDVASPRGGDAPIDPNSMAPELADYVPHTRRTLAFAAIDAAAYDAYFVVGGHGTMWDLPDDPILARLLPQAYAQGKILAAVCHGPAALARLRDAGGRYLIAGKRVAGFSNAEEQAAQLSKVVPFLLEDALTAAGGRYSCAPLWQAHVAVDARIVTGQNPASAQGVAEVVVQLLATDARASGTGA